jgi:hypothetical protein
MTGAAGASGEDGVSGMTSEGGVSGTGGVGGKLERRYRSLLTWYPAEHRYRYQEEMLGVMLAGARTGQRYPGWGETVDVLVAAVRMRLGRLAPGVRDTRWSDAAATAGVLLSMLLFAYRLRPVVRVYAWSVRLRGVEHTGPLRALLPPSVWLPALAALVITAAVMTGRQAVAVTVAWATVLGSAVMLVRHSAFSLYTVSALWLVVVAVIVAVSLSISGTTGRVRSVLGWRRITLFATACVLLTLSPAADALAATVTPDGPNAYQVSLWPGGGGYLRQIFPADGTGTELATFLVYLAVIVMMIIVIARIAVPIRRRLLALLTPALVFFAVISLFFQAYGAFGIYDSSVYYLSPGPLVPEQWAVLVGAPAVAFLAAVIAVYRRDRSEHLMELGRAAERQSVLAEPPESPESPESPEDEPHNGDGSSRSRL